MPESKSSKKTTEAPVAEHQRAAEHQRVAEHQRAAEKLRSAENSRGAKEKREFDAELISLLDGLRIAPNHQGESENAGQPLNVQPPEPELVSRLVKFIKKL